MPSPTGSPLSGILLVDKPAGPTSHDVVLRVRRALGTSRIGHCGTLDPAATGLLIMLIGSATKIQAGFQLYPKTYSGTARLGVTTDTGDLDGRILESRTVPPLSLGDLEREMKALTGPVELPLPQYCAVKKQGKPLYYYARHGIPIDPILRVQQVHAWEPLGWEPPALRFLMRCASGTYVRSLVVELGRRLSCGAVLESLRREAIGRFRAEEAVSIEAFERMDAPQRLKLLRDPEDRRASAAAAALPSDA